MIVAFSYITFWLAFVGLLIAIYKGGRHIITHIGLKLEGSLNYFMLGPLAYFIITLVAQAQIIELEQYGWRVYLVFAGSVVNLVLLLAAPVPGMKNLYEFTCYWAGIYKALPNFDFLHPFRRKGNRR